MGLESNLHLCKSPGFHASYFDTNYPLHVSYPTSTAKSLRATIRAIIPEVTPEQ